MTTTNWGGWVGVVDSQNGAAIYSYDAVGNILSISRVSSGQVSIIGFTPKSGPVGTTVTISGTAFSTTASENTVKFHGTNAVVSSATAMQLVSTVPSGATTGPITVTTPSGSATSSTSFTVTTSSGAPTITGFNPTIGNVGAAVTVSGTNFDTPANDKLKFNLGFATVSSATGTSLSTTVPAGATSGHVTLATPMGNAVSSADFFVPPSAYTPSSVDFKSRIAMGGTFTGAIGTGSHIGLLVFDGTAGHKFSLQITGVTIGSATVSVNNPNGSLLTQINVDPNGLLLMAQHCRPPEPTPS
jgi:hypothetical protein